MAIKILTIEEAKETKELAEKYGEVCEVVEGVAPINYVCDNTGVEIKRGERCASVLLLPNKEHHNYEHQLALLRHYIIADN
jgi:hypothetical protein